MIKNVLFDWSGVISDDFKIVYNSSMAVFEKCGKAKISMDDYRDEFELPYMNFYKRFGIDLEKKDVDEIFDKAYENSEVKAEMYPDVKETLDKLTDTNIIIGIISSGLSKYIRADMKRFDIHSYFKYISYRVENKRIGIKEAMHCIYLDPEETIYVGDMMYDIFSGRDAGVKTAGITRGYTEAYRLANARPNYMINNLGDLLRVIEESKNPKAYEIILPSPEENRI